MAIDILPRDYLPAPAGTNLTALYYLYNHSDTLSVAGGSTVKNDTGVQANLGVLRQIYYGGVDDRSWAAQLVVPYGSASGKIGGQELQGVSGLGDINVSGGISLLPRPEPKRNVGVVLYVSSPTGNYSPTRVLNLGANRWGFDTQVGYTQGIGDNFWFDAAADAILYTNNDNAGPNEGKLRKNPTYQGQTWFSYLPDEVSLVSIGYAANRGGTETIDHTRNGVKTESQQVRLAYTRYLTSSFQVAAQISRDVVVTGGLKQNFGLTLRAFYLY